MEPYKLQFLTGEGWQTDRELDSEDLAIAHWSAIGKANTWTGHVQVIQGDRVVRSTIKKLMPIKKYRKRPVVIEAVRFDGTLQSIQGMNILSVSHDFINGTCQIETLEGVMTANKGDYIIKGVKGEFYPCKPEIFEATYDLEPSGQTSMADRSDTTAKVAALADRFIVVDVDSGLRLDDETDGIGFSTADAAERWILNEGYTFSRG